MRDKKLYLIKKRDKKVLLKNFKIKKKNRNRKLEKAEEKIEFLKKNNSL